MFGEHAAFIIPAYAITTIAILAAIFVNVSTYKRRKAELHKLNAADSFEPNRR